MYRVAAPPASLDWKVMMYPRESTMKPEPTAWRSLEESEPSSPPTPPWPPKKRLRKSCMSPGAWSSGLLLSPPLGAAWPRRGARRVADSLGRVMVLMLTTAGPTCFAILEKSLERLTGFGTVSGRASEESTVCSLPLTPRVIREPARMPTESVASSAKVAVRRWVRMRSKRSRGACFDVSIDDLILIRAGGSGLRGYLRH